MTSRDEMTDRDYADAAVALIDWIDTQDFNPDQAGRVLTMALIGVIRGIATVRGKDAKVGGKIITDIITESLS